MRWLGRPEPVDNTYWRSDGGSRTGTEGTLSCGVLRRNPGVRDVPGSTTFLQRLADRLNHELARRDSPVQADLPHLDPEWNRNAANVNVLGVSLTHSPYDIKVLQPALMCGRSSGFVAESSAATPDSSRFSPLSAEALFSSAVPRVDSQNEPGSRLFRWRIKTNRANQDMISSLFRAIRPGFHLIFIYAIALASDPLEPWVAWGT